MTLINDWTTLRLARPHAPFRCGYPRVVSSFPEPCPGPFCIRHPPRPRRAFWYQCFWLSASAGVASSRAGSHELPRSISRPRPLRRLSFPRCGARENPTPSGGLVACCTRAGNTNNDITDKHAYGRGLSWFWFAFPPHPSGPAGRKSPFQ